MTDRFAEVDDLAEAFQRRDGQPGLVYGVVSGGELVHARGLGERRPGGPAPAAGTVFRIASMTKSFTAASVLLLRDEGLLSLDDEAGKHVPQLNGLRLPTADSPPLTLRHLLTMTAGFPTDDPWGDRQQGMPLADFRQLLADGVSFNWVPGTRFEYSNLGYAILGLVIHAVSGQPYREFVTQRLLEPLGMTSTGFDAADFGAEQLAAGHQREPDGWAELPWDPYGAFAPMGGVFSCVDDLARWVSGFAAAFPSGGGDGGPHPLRPATRREMQLPQVAVMPQAFTRLPGDPAATGPASYGFGLFVEEGAARGRVVQHSGGYPGFGSNMRWHPATGTGVIVLANSTYAAASALAVRLLDAALRLAAPAGPVRPASEPWPATLAAREQVSALLRSWDDTAAARLFSENVAQDEPMAQRQAKAGLLRERIGTFTDDPGRDPEHDTPAHCRWWLRGGGDTASVQVEIQLTPERRPRVMSLDLALPPAPGSPLAGTLATLVQLLNDGAPEWPAAVEVAAGVDTARLLRQFRMAAAWAGRCVPTAIRAGNGETTATVELTGGTGVLSLAVAVGRVGGLLDQADILLGT